VSYQDYKPGNRVENLRDGMSNVQCIPCPSIQGSLVPYSGLTLPNLTFIRMSLPAAAFELGDVHSSCQISSPANRFLSHIRNTTPVPLSRGSIGHYRSRDERCQDCFAICCSCRQPPTAPPQGGQRKKAAQKYYLHPKSPSVLQPTLCGPLPLGRCIAR
jgi:hypothetical protein